MRTDLMDGYAPHGIRSTHAVAQVAKRLWLYPATSRRSHTLFSQWRSCPAALMQARYL